VANLARKVVLIGWGSASWKQLQPLLEGPEMPFLSTLVSSGIMADLQAHQPAHACPFWTSVATGLLPTEHRVLTCGTCAIIADGQYCVRCTPAGSHPTAIWDLLAAAGKRAIVINWPAIGPRPGFDGCFVRNFTEHTDIGNSSWFLSKGQALLSKRMAQIAKRRRVMQEVVLRGLFDGLQARSADVEEGLLHASAAIAANWAVHALTVAAIQSETWDFAAVYYPALDYSCTAHLRRLCEDSVNRGKCRQIESTVFGLLDKSLARISKYAGSDGTIFLISHHSATPRKTSVPFAHDVTISNVPRSCDGVFCAKGPDFKQDERIYGVKSTDVTRAILALFDPERHAGISGSVQGCAGVPEPEQRTESHGHSVSVAELSLVPFESAALAPCLPECPETCRMTKIVVMWTWAQFLFSGNRPAEAKQIIMGLKAEWPHHPELIATLAKCHIVLGENEQALKLIDEALGADTAVPAMVRILAAEAYCKLARPLESRMMLAGIEVASVSSDICIQLAHRYADLGAVAEAIVILDNIVKEEEQNDAAYEALAQVYLKARMFHRALDAAEAAIRLKYDLPRSHFRRGVALLFLGDTYAAIRAFETSLTFGLPLPGAHAWLSRLYLNKGCQVERSRSHTRRLLECGYGVAVQPGGNGTNTIWNCSSLVSASTRL
jgi:tetratricopeptide (TPR) repeat protein